VLLPIGAPVLALLRRVALAGIAVATLGAIIMAC
jgi:hypothetical protein